MVTHALRKPYDCESSTDQSQIFLRIIKPVKAHYQPFKVIHVMNACDFSALVIRCKIV